MGNESSSLRKGRSKKKNHSSENSAPNGKKDETSKKNNKKSAPKMELSADTFSRQVPSRRSYVNDEYDPVMITDELSNVKERYHINPKE